MSTVENDPIPWLQKWYETQCDGDWEHQYGVKIETLDNPGWVVFIDINVTHLESEHFVPIQIDRSEENWMRCEVEKECFRGVGGVYNLIEILNTFRSWANSPQE